MKHLLLYIFGFFIFVSVNYAQTQLEINQQAYEEYKKVDKLLNDSYNKILKKYSKNPIFIANLKTAQRAWIKFRDAQVAAKYPREPVGRYGSMQAYCESNYLAELTQKRAKELEEWLKPVEEGDGCSGTIGEYEFEQ